MKRNSPWRGLIILGLCLLVGVGGGVGLWFAADAAARRYAERELGALRALGFPMTVAEAWPPPVPEAQNAAPLYLSLFQVSLDPRTQTPSSVPHGLHQIQLGDYRATPADAYAVRAEIASPRAQEALRVLREASRRPFCQFPMDWAGGYMEMRFPHLPQLRHAARLLTAQALLEARAGHLQEALDWLAVSYRLAEHAAQDPSQMNQLVSVAIYAINDRAAHAILETRALSTGQALRLHDQLPHTDFAARQRAAMYMEFAMMHGVILDESELAAVLPMAYDKNVVLRFSVGLELSDVGRPLRRLEEANLAQHVGRRMFTSLRPYRGAHPHDEILPLPGIMLTALLQWGYEHGGQKRDEAIARQGLLHAVLLLKAYRSEHGAYPSTLQPLARPVAADPFTGKPFIYRRHGKGFVIYSIGPNLQDDGGHPPRERQSLNGEGDIVWNCPR